MKYNFDEVIDRKNTDSMKWSASYLERHFGSADCVPLWVADMDFRTAQPVIDAVTERAGHGIYGYALAGDEFYEAVIKWQKRRNGWEVKKEWIVFSPGVVPALWHIVRTFCSPGEKVILQSPVYYPFYKVIEDNGCQVINNRLINNGGRYEMNFDELEKQAADGSVRMMILCSPHNPVSRVWSREELQALLDLLDRYGVPLASDEIHADFVYAPNTFVPVLSLKRENVLSLCAASKTFNLAGLQQASCLCGDTAIREAFRREMNKAGVRSGNIFALEATRAAYEQGDAWLDGLLRYLDGSRVLLAELVRRHLPRAVLSPMDGTYLGWLDLRAYGYTTEELMERTTRAGVRFTGGTFFGEKTGEGFLRINIGCPRRYLEEGVLRLRVALEKGDED